MFTRYINILFLVGFIVIWAVCGVGVPFCQAQPSSSSSHDTTAQKAEEEERPAVTREKIKYSSNGRKDPFLPLFEKKEEEEELPPLNVEGAALVGIMAGQNGGLALVRDTEGRTYVLRKGARVKNGYLRRIRSDAAIFNVAKYGRYRKVELELKSEKRADSFEKGVIEIRPKPKPVAQKSPVNPPAKPPEGLMDVPLSADSKFTLQVAAFRQEEEAQRMQQWLWGRGYETRIETVTHPESGRWFRVRYGVYETYDTVKEVAESFRERFDFYCWIVPIDS